MRVRVVVVLLFVLVAAAVIYTGPKASAKLNQSPPGHGLEQITSLTSFGQEPRSGLEATSVIDRQSRLNSVSEIDAGREFDGRFEFDAKSAAKVHSRRDTRTIGVAAEGHNTENSRGRWVEAQVNALVNAARAAFEDDHAMPAYHRTLRRIAFDIRRRGLLRNQGFADRYSNFLQFVQTADLDQQPGHELGFETPDKQYFDETRRYVQVPDFLLDPEFLHSVSRYETLDKAKAYLRRLNSQRGPQDQLIFFSYKSRHLGTPDNDDSFIRLLIVVPGNAKENVPEKWVQFGVTDPGVRVRTRNVSVVSAVRNSDGTFDAYFKDFFRTYNPNGSISIKGRWELGYGDDNCAICHKSGILPIFPDKGSVSSEEEPAVDAVNALFRSYGSPRFGKYLDETCFGPGLGSKIGNNVSDSEGREEGKSQIVESARCSQCHNPSGIGWLNWPLDPVVVESFVKGGKMPFGKSLSDSDRDKLYDFLIESYFSTDRSNPGTLKSWLLRTNDSHPKGN